jgi:TetR/AcrR family transcriptional regulator, mexJK operon transcriptional repressor
MEAIPLSRSERKRQSLLRVATGIFLEKGFDGASMDEVAAKAAVSKPTVYKYFTDKERLFAEVVRATTVQMDELVRLVAENLTAQTSAEPGLTVLAQRFLTALMKPDILRLRRLVIANADRFPEVSRSWYEQGFERALATLAAGFQSLADRRLLKLDDPMLAAHHFVGLLLWIPINKAMFTGDHRSSPDALKKTAAAAVRAFLSGYGPATPPANRSARVSASHKI